ncbi:MAG: hypothetical protein GY904_20660 [Planctomycetaceae bacterium]|nr:hypothetical protein [Planctomycetaceae bacterium]
MPDHHICIEEQWYPELATQCMPNRSGSDFQNINEAANLPDKHKTPNGPAAGTPGQGATDDVTQERGIPTDSESKKERSFLAAIDGRNLPSSRESSEAFSAEQARPITSRELLNEQLKISQQVTKLSDKVDRLHSYAVIANLVGCLIICSILAIGTTIYLRPDVVAHLVPPNGGPTTEPLTPSTPETLQPSFALDTNQEFNIDNDTDYEFYKRLRTLYIRMRGIRPPSGTPELRRAANDNYLDFINDVLDTVEDASKADIAPEIIRAIAAVAEVGKARRAADNADYLDEETEDKHDQIRRVLRASDIRTDFPQEW